jgi:hypothetical protein
LLFAALSGTSAEFAILADYSIQPILRGLVARETLLL